MSTANNPYANSPHGDTRVLAAQIIFDLLYSGRSLGDTLPLADAKIIQARDRGLLRAIVFATVRDLYVLQALLDQLLSKPLKSSDRIIHAVLLTALAQIKHEIGAPYAAVSESVDATRKLNRPALAGLVNGVLRRYLREQTTLLAALPKTPVVQFNHPQWLLQRIQKDWPDHSDSIFAANNAAAPMWLRVNRQRSDVKTLQQSLHEAGFTATLDESMADALRLENVVDPTSLPGFSEGLISVQDAAAQACVELLDLKPGLRVLDACAAPGGKAAHIYERCPELSTLLALDVSAQRVQRMQQAFDRLGINAESKTADASKPETWWGGVKFDRILIDAPCTGTGVIRRHPDIRVLRRDTDIAQLCQQQSQLLNALWPLLAAGGRMLYATCSILRDENDRQIEAFLQRTPNARSEALSWRQAGRAVGPGWQVLPGERGMDGFFYAQLTHHSA